MHCHLRERHPPKAPKFFQRSYKATVFFFSFLPFPTQCHFQSLVPIYLPMTPAHGKVIGEGSKAKSSEVAIHVISCAVTRTEKPWFQLYTLFLTDSSWLCSYLDAQVFSTLPSEGRGICYLMAFSIQPKRESWHRMSFSSVLHQLLRKTFQTAQLMTLVYFINLALIH